MTSLTLCEGSDCSVPITEVTKHKIFVTFCKPCGRSQRKATGGTSSKVKNRYSPAHGNLWVLNEKDVWVLDDDRSFAVVKENGRFSLFIRGIRTFNKTTLAACMNYADEWLGRAEQGLENAHYQFRRYEGTKRLALELIGPWIEFAHLGTRDDQPFTKANLQKDPNELVKPKFASGRVGAALEYYVDHQVNQDGWLPYVR